MDINDLRIIVTLLSFGVFAGMRLQARYPDTLGNEGLDEGSLEEVGFPNSQRPIPNSQLPVLPA